MFKTPVSTIRDVAELTDASPSLIARLLGEMRGPGEYEKLVGRVDAHDQRFNRVEGRVDALENRRYQRTQLAEKDAAKEFQGVVSAIIAVIAILAMVFAGVGSSKTTTIVASPALWRTYSTTIGGREFTTDDASEIYEIVNGKDVLLKDDDPAMAEAKGFFIVWMVNDQKHQGQR